MLSPPAATTVDEAETEDVVEGTADVVVAAEVAEEVEVEVTVVVMAVETSNGWVGLTNAKNVRIVHKPRRSTERGR